MAHAPPPSGSSTLPSDGRPDFLQRLGVMLPCNEEDVKQAYLAKAKTMHPDVGGNHEAFLELQTDFERAQQYCRFHAGRSRWLAESIERYVEQQGAIEELQARGGRVSLEHLDWLKREIGEDFAQVLDTIAGVTLTGPQVTDADLEFLASRKDVLSTMHWVDVSRSKITDAGLVHLLAFPNLRKLDLRETGVGNAGLKQLEGLANLEWLGLSGTRVNWLGRLQSRRWLRDIEIG